MKPVNLNQPHTVLGPFKSFSYVASSMELVEAGTPELEAQVERVGNLLEQTLARHAHYVSFPQARIDTIDASREELVLMHENARIKFKQCLIRLEDELEKLKTLITNPEDADGFSMEADVEAVQLNFINLVELLEVGSAALKQLQAGLKDAPEGYAQIVECHFRKRLEAHLSAD